MVGNKKAFKFVEELNKESLKEKPLGTGLLGEQLIITAYKRMPLSDLEKLKFIMNKIIKEKKEYKRIQDAKNNTSTDAVDNKHDNLPI